MWDRKFYFSIKKTRREKYFIVTIIRNNFLEKMRDYFYLYNVDVWKINISKNFFFGFIHKIRVALCCYLTLVMNFLMTVFTIQLSAVHKNKYLSSSDSKI